MTDSQLCEIIVILDRSGSMANMKQEMEGGLNAFVEEQKKLPGRCAFTLVQFDSNGIDTLHEAEPIGRIGAITLVPRGMTPLLDAVGQTLVRVGERLARVPDERRPGKVLVMIVTDGAENASREYTGQRVRAMVTEQHERYQWQFMYLGANVDAFTEAGVMGVAASSASGYGGKQFAAQALNLASSKVGAFRSASSPTEITNAMTYTDDERKSIGGDALDKTGTSTSTATTTSAGPGAT